MTLEFLWYLFALALIATYVVLDGFDLGVGIVHWMAGRSASERNTVLRSIMPFWDGNEVWLVAAAATIYLAFPAVYASAFSGFYVPLMLVAWMLILRGISIEFRGHVRNPSWVSFWDVMFSLSSALLVILFGAALGNIVRGVPLDAEGWFTLSMWPDLGSWEQITVLDSYTVSVALFCLAAITYHGALWLAVKTQGAVGNRASRIAKLSFYAVCLLMVLVTALTFAVQPAVGRNLSDRPFIWIFPLTALAGLWFSRAELARGNARRAFGGFCVFITGMLLAAASGVYPCLIPATTGAEFAITVHNAAAPAYGLKVGLVWWIPGMILTVVYFRFLYRRLSGKVTAEDTGYGY